MNEKTNTGNSTKQQADENVVFASLQLIQELFINGQISEIVYKNIIKDCEKRIDISKIP